MASSSLSCSCALVLILLLVAVTPVPGASEQRVPITATVTECYPATNVTNSTAFRADVLSLLAALPSAAAPTGFATLRSGHAFVRGLCFDDAAPSVCLRCLSVAAKNLNLTSGCGASSHLAGIWNDGCFVSYADNNATTASEDAQHPRVISGADPLGRNASYSDLQRLGAVAQFLAAPAAVTDNMLATVNTTALAWDYSANSTVRVLAQCARDRTAAECDRCLEYSARVAASCCWGLDPWRNGVAAAVLGFNCYLRFEVYAERVPLRQRIGMLVAGYPCTATVLAVVVALLVGGALARLIREINTCRMERKIRAVNNARNATASGVVGSPRARVELAHVHRAQAS